LVLNIQQTKTFGNIIGLAIVASTHDMFFFGPFVRNIVKLSFDGGYQVRNPEAAVQLRSEVNLSQHNSEGLCTV
jgi:hypothetical protein